MKTSKVGSGAPTGNKTMLPVSRKAAVASPKINRVSVGKAMPVSGVKMGTTVHAPGADGFSQHGMC